MHIFILVVIVIFLIFVAFCLLGSLFFIHAGLDRNSKWYEKVGHKLFDPDFGNHEEPEYKEIRERQKKEGDDFWEKEYTTDLTIEYAGETLWAREFMRYPDSHQWVICIHGYRDDGKIDMAFPASKYSEAGFNVLVPDLGAHGNSTGKKIGMGWLEKNQIEEWIHQVILPKDEQAEITLFGGSMGAATVMMSSGDDLPEQVKVLIADCGYSSVYHEFSYLLKNAIHLPPGPILFFAEFFFKQYMGFSLKSASSIKQLNKNTRPILFIHGTRDKFVPYSDMAINFAATQGVKERLTVENAPHLSSWVYEEEVYFNTVFRFIKDNL